MFKTSKNQNGRGNGVYCGDDGWMYWVGRRGEKQALYRRNIRNYIRYLRWERLIRDRSAASASMNLEYYQLIIPDKLSVSDRINSHEIVDVRYSPIRRISRNIRGAAYEDRFINALDVLGADTEQAKRCFLKTDSHTSYRGYIEIYKILCRALRVDPAENVLNGALHAGQLALDLGGKFDPPVLEDYIHYEFDKHAVRTFSNDVNDARENPSSNRIVNRGSIIVFNNSHACASTKKIVIFGDSYTFVRSAVGEMLAENFSETHLIWSSSINWPYIHKIRPDIILCETAERFTHSVPNDVK